MDVLIVEDCETMRSRLRRSLASEHGVDARVGNDPLAALAGAKTGAFDLVLVGQHMTGMDGVTFIRELRAVPRYAQAPIAMFTAEACAFVRDRALEAGATDVLDKRIDGVDLDIRLRNLVRLAGAVRRLDEQAAILAEEIERSARHLREREAEIIFRLALAVEYRDNDTGEHAWRVARYGQLIAEAMGLGPEFCNDLYLAAPLHDVGKVAIPDGILLKKGRLDAAEFAVVRSHPLVGRRILGGSGSELIRLAAEIAEAHHERWDGGGYPHGLSGEAIPLSARIVAVADVFDALTTARPYKAAMDLDQARACIEAERGRHFDPACVDAFMAAWTAISLVRTGSMGPRRDHTVGNLKPWISTSMARPWTAPADMGFAEADFASQKPGLHGATPPIGRNPEARPHLRSRARRRKEW